MLEIQLGSVPGSILPFVIRGDFTLQIFDSMSLINDHLPCSFRLNHPPRQPTTLMSSMSAKDTVSRLTVIERLESQERISVMAKSA